MKQQFSIYLLVFLCFLSSCKKNDTARPYENDTPEPITTQRGIPVGTAVTRNIGPAGGTLSSTDGKLTVRVPAGAVTNNTSFSIQPISNTLYSDVDDRLAYRLLPEGVNFN